MPRRTSNFISAEEARRIVIRAQGLSPASRPGDAGEVLQRTRAVQLDTISVLARSHELVAYARLGPVPRAEVESAYWSSPATAFEYFAHANCVLPMEDWPWFHFRRGQLRSGAWPQLTNSPVFDEVRAALRDGPITTTDVGGARKTAGWWNWSEAKQALELMFARGEVVCAMRRNWKRVYDLPERVVPAQQLARTPSVEESYLYLIRQAARALGIGTRRDIANYYMLLTSYMGRGLDRKRLFEQAMDASGLVEMQVEGWGEPAYAFEDVVNVKPAKTHRTTLLSPFDSLIWAEPRVGSGPLRARTARVFGYDMIFEPYVPKEKRVHGYFTMPLLAGERIVGHVDPAREGKMLVARNVELHDVTAIDEMGAALREAAQWVGCESVRLERVKPKSIATPLKRAVS
jgi:hypothetical protein